MLMYRARSLAKSGKSGETLALDAPAYWRSQVEAENAELEKEREAYELQENTISVTIQTPRMYTVGPNDLIKAEAAADGGKAPDAGDAEDDAAGGSDSKDGEAAENNAGADVANTGLTVQVDQRITVAELKEQVRLPAVLALAPKGTLTAPPFLPSIPYSCSRVPLQR